jgi:TolA-binding protein
MRLRSFCRVRVLALPLALVSAFGCAAPEPDTELSTALQAAREAAGDSTRRDEAITLLEEFVRTHSSDSSVPDALMQLAILRQQQGDMVAAIADYQQILESFPASDTADEAQFMIAFVYEEHLQDLDGARRAYQALIDNYPNAELVDQARQLLEHVGQSPDEWVTFQESSAEDPQ